MKTAKIFKDKTGKKYIITGGVHEDRAFIIAQRGNLVVTKPFSGGGLTFSSYYADYRVYDLRLTKRGQEDARQIAEFEHKRDALDYLEWKSGD